MLCLFAGPLRVMPASSRPASPPTSQHMSMMPSSDPSTESATSACSGSGSSFGSSSGSGQVATSGDHVFVVHSQHSLENKKPPEIDNKTLARQKRKRTRYASCC